LYCTVLYQSVLNKQLNTTTHDAGIQTDAVLDALLSFEPLLYRGACLSVTSLASVNSVTQFNASTAVIGHWANPAKGSNTGRRPGIVGRRPTTGCK